MTTPQAAIKFFGPSGNEIEEGFYSAPVAYGQLVTLSDGNKYRVSEVSWPFRVNGVCPDGQTDWEYAKTTLMSLPTG
jgi:hypothetical protein